MLRFYYGWRIVFMAAIVYMSLTGVIYGAFGLYVLPVSEDLGLSRTDMNMGLILLNLGNAALAPFVGRALDRLSARWIMMAGAVLFGISFVALGLSRSLLLSALVLLTLLPFANMTGGVMTMPVLLARWFTSQRGRAMALASTGMFLGSIVTVPVVALLLEAYGWRMTLILLGVGVGFMLVMLSLVVRERPAPGEGEGGAIPVPATGTAAPLDKPEPVLSLLRKPLLWMICGSAALNMGVGQAIMISLVPLARESGLSMIEAASLVSISGGSGLAGAMLLATVADRFDRATVLTALFLLSAGVAAVLIFSSNYTMLLASAVLLGVAMGGVPPLFYAILADRFGAASFGTVRGIGIPMGAAAGMAAILFVGYVYDTTGGYDLAFTIFLGAQLVAAALMFTARIRRPAIAALQPDTSA